MTWSASSGTISPSGLYTAPVAAGTYVIIATSVADTTQSGTATVTVTTGSPAISRLDYSKLGSAANGNHAAVHRDSDGNKQYGGKLVCFQRNSFEFRPLHRTHYRWHLHGEGDQFRG